ncbi:MAG TPA: hypothetical protein PLZ93_22325 [Nocardioides sp.]|uniref:hypothetical protein n=1 Tax=uncultured Nocardioides sp. TaxID=198441 RepID=UPI000EDB75AD|nr:hypothetical protein [uncultured Nocardioides sp.]HCB07016.1 hypothetical protein [Nocardioides sp.]HRI98378.1 hypothetical protein [Nocardioides sp.]
MGARLAPVTLLAGIALGVATVAVYQWWWGLLLAAVASVLVTIATPAGWGSRLPFALGFDAVAVLAAVPRGEGDYLLTSTGAGYAVLGLALVVLMLAVATLPRPGAKSTRTSRETTTLE